MGDSTRIKQDKIKMREKIHDIVQPGNMYDQSQLRYLLHDLSLPKLEYLAHVLGILSAEKQYSEAGVSSAVSDGYIPGKDA